MSIGRIWPRAYSPQSSTAPSSPSWRHAISPGKTSRADIESFDERGHPGHRAEPSVRRDAQGDQPVDTPVATQPARAPHVIRIEKTGDVAVLRMAHGKANALDTELCRELARRLDEAGDSHRAVVLTGQDRMFSAGVDLRRIQQGGRAYTREFIRA